MKILSYLFLSLLLVKINETSYMKINSNLKQINTKIITNENDNFNKIDKSKISITNNTTLKVSNSQRNLSDSIKLDKNNKENKISNSNKLKTTSKDNSSNKSLLDKFFFAKEIQYFYSSKIKYYKKVKISCNIYNCKPLFGTCDDKKEICTCMPGQVHVPKLLSKKRICRYKQYTWIYCLIFELLLPGLGILYFNDYMIGLAKIFLIPIVYYYWNDSKGLNSLLISIVGWLLIIYHVRDISLLISNNLRDRNGVFPE
jgi:hypothetical protein